MDQQTLRMLPEQTDTITLVAGAQEDRRIALTPLQVRGPANEFLGRCLSNWVILCSLTTPTAGASESSSRPTSKPEAGPSRSGVTSAG